MITGTTADGETNVAYAKSKSMRLKLDMATGGGSRDSVWTAATVAYPNATPETSVYTEDADTVLLRKTPAGEKRVLSRGSVISVVFSIVGAKTFTNRYLLTLYRSSGHNSLLYFILYSI